MNYTKFIFDDSKLARIKKSLKYARPDLPNHISPRRVLVNMERPPMKSFRSPPITSKSARTMRPKSAVSQKSRLRQYLQLSPMRSSERDRKTLNLAGKRAHMDEPKHLQSKSFNTKELELKIKKPRPPSHYARPPSNYFRGRNKSNVETSRKASPLIYDDDCVQLFKAIYN